MCCRRHVGRRQMRSVHSYQCANRVTFAGAFKQWNRNPRPQLEPQINQFWNCMLNSILLETPIYWSSGVGVGGSHFIGERRASGGLTRISAESRCTSISISRSSITITITLTLTLTLTISCIVWLSSLSWPCATGRKLSGLPEVPLHGLFRSGGVCWREREREREQ